MYGYGTAQTQQQSGYPQNNYSRQQPMQAPYLKGRPVSSLEEVRATGIDFDGSVFFFPDLANKRIYTKQINMDGTASLKMYELKEIPTEVPVNTSDFVTRQEFEQVIQQFQNTLLNAVQQPQKEEKKELTF